MHLPARVPLEEAREVLAEVRRRLALGGRRVRSAVVGSVRRGQESTKDLDLLVFAPGGRVRGVLGALALRPPEKGDALRFGPDVAGGDRRRTLQLRGRGRRRYQLDLFLATAAEAPYALFHHTGGWEYNVRVRRLARGKGWKLNQYGLFYRGTKRRVRGSARVRTERALARFLGITPRPPEAR